MPSSVASHSVPSFYTCYFLRSIASPSSTYIGSTPDPRRRKRQHNGDLTQGACKTMRARPWEMECIVYGFSSKIAALQFEWAWASPHLTRHLKVLPSETDTSPVGDPTSGAEGGSRTVGTSLFPSTSMTPGQTKWGKPKRRRPKPSSNPNSRLLVMRALLRSEPFSGWGLKIAFFTEWSWLAFQRLEQRRRELQIASASMSRSGQNMHPEYPIQVCDFSGVDRKREALCSLPEGARREAGVSALPIIKKPQKKNASSLQAGASAPGWPETLPKSSNLKALGASELDFASFPVPSSPIASSDITMKAKRVRKDVSSVETSASEDESDASLAMVQTPLASKRNGLSPYPMRFTDEELAELEWARFCRVLDDVGQRGAESTAVASYMTDAVKLHKSSFAGQPIDSNGVITRPCAICKSAVDLTEHLEFSLCPQPHAACLPKSNTTAEEDIEHDPECSSVFHVSCLATAFIDQSRSPLQPNESEEVEAVLPTHGQCPTCIAKQSGGLGPDMPPHNISFWSDVIRAVYRRRDRFERLRLLLAQSGQSLEHHLSLYNSASFSPKKRTKLKDVAAAKTSPVDAPRSPSEKTAKRKPASAVQSSPGKTPKSASRAKATKKKTVSKKRLSEGGKASLPPEVDTVTIDLT